MDTFETIKDSKSHSSVPSGSTNSVLSPKGISPKDPSPKIGSPKMGSPKSIYGVKDDYHKGKKINGFLRKAGAEFGLFLLKLKNLGDETFNDDLVSELFVEQDSYKINEKKYSEKEELFLTEYKKFKSLDKLFEHHQKIRYQYLESTKQIHSQHKPQEDSENGDGDDDDDEKSGSENAIDDEYNKRHFNDYDFTNIKIDMDANNSDFGDTLWNYRREKWLVSSNPRQLNNYFDEIPKDNYVKIYSNLVEKGKSLKPEMQLNLGDLMKVINAGWIAEAKWERAAKGLP